MADLAKHFNWFMDTLHALIGRVRATTQTVASAAQQLAAGSGQLSSGAQEQAISLEETAAPLEQMTATIKQNADNARQANQMASSAREAAERGGVVVQEAVVTMGAITEATGSTPPGSRLRGCRGGWGPAGLARLAEGAVDLVLTDLGMPDMNGWEVARAVKAWAPNVPVSRAGHREGRRARARGVHRT